MKKLIFLAMLLPFLFIGCITSSEKEVVKYATIEAIYTTWGYAFSIDVTINVEGYIIEDYAVYDSTDYNSGDYTYHINTCYYHLNTKKFKVPATGQVSFKFDYDDKIYYKDIKEGVNKLYF